MKNLCEQVALYFYGEMEPQAAATFKEHAAQCPACQQELAFLQSVQAALVPPATPQAVVERVLVKSPVSLWRRCYKWALVATVVLGLGVWGFIGRTTLSDVDDTTPEWLAYVSDEMDSDYYSFMTELEAFEEDF